MSAHDGAPLPPEHARGGPSACPWLESLAAHALGALALHEVPGVLAHLAGGCAVCRAEHARLLETLATMDTLSVDGPSADTLGAGMLNADVPDARKAPQLPGAPAAAAARSRIPGPGPTVKARLLEAAARTPQDPAPSVNPEPSAPASRPGAPARDFHRPWRHAEAAPGRFAQGLTTIAAAGLGNDGFERTGIEGIEAKTLFVDAARRRVSMMVRMAPGTSYPAHRHAAVEECFVVAGDIRVGERVLRAGDYQVAAEDSIHGVQSTEQGCVLFIVSSQDDELV